VSWKVLPPVVNRASVCLGYQPLRTDWRYRQAMIKGQPTDSDKTIAPVVPVVPVRNDRHIWVEKPVVMPCSSSGWYSHTLRAVNLLLHQAHTFHFAGQSSVSPEPTRVQRNWTTRNVGVGEYWQASPHCIGRVQHDWLVGVGKYWQGFPHCIGRVQHDWLVGVGKYWQGFPHCIGRVQHDWLVYIARYQSEWSLLVCLSADNQSVDNRPANNCSVDDCQQSDWPDKPVPGYRSPWGCRLRLGDFQPRPTRSQMG